MDFKINFEYARIFLSTYLILYKDNTVDTVLRQAEISEKDRKDLNKYS